MNTAAVDLKLVVGVIVGPFDAYAARVEAARELHAAGSGNSKIDAIVSAIVELADAGEPISIQAIRDRTERTPNHDPILLSEISGLASGTPDRVTGQTVETRTAKAAVKAFLEHRERKRHGDSLRRALEMLEVGGDLDEYRAFILEQLQATPEATGADPAAQFVRIGEIPIQPPEYLVKPLIERDVTAAIIGRPGSFKSFLALSVGASVATGTEWHGHRVTQGPALFIAAEGQAGIRRRVRAWEIVNGIALQDHPFLIRRRSAALTDPAAWPELKSKIDAAAREVGPPLLVVLDTLSANFGPGHESDTGDMAAAMGTVNRIRAAYGCTVLIVHHPALSDPRRARGSSVQVGALDRAYILERDDNGTARLQSTKVKDDGEPDPLAFMFSRVDLGIVDTDGDPVASGVLSRVDYTDPQAAGPVRGVKQRKALALLSALIADHRENLTRSGRDPDGAHVAVDRWRDTCARNGIDRRRFSEVKKSLSEGGLIRFIHGGYVEITETGEASVDPSDRPSGVRSVPLKGGPDGRTQDTGRKPDNSDANRTQTGHKSDNGSEAADTMTPEQRQWWDQHRDEVY